MTNSPISRQYTAEFSDILINILNYVLISSSIKNSQVIPVPKPPKTLVKIKQFGIEMCDYFVCLYNTSWSTKSYLVFLAFLRLTILCSLSILSSRLTSRAYSIPMVRRPSTMFKHIIVRNHLANRNQILCEASIPKGNDLFGASELHNQFCRLVHSKKFSVTSGPISTEPFILLPNQRT